MQVASKAVWTIERNFDKSLALGDIADACGVSSFHLAHAFGLATGRSVMSYVRGRRLSEAAKKLANGSPDILSVALDAGYASHEAFTRAFREQFGVTPETVKRDGTAKSFALVAPMDLPETNAAKLDPPEIGKLRSVTVIGLSERQAFDAPHKIPSQWQQFMTMYELIEKKVDEIPVGVSWNLDDDGTFEYMCGVEVARDSETPRGLTKTTLAPQTYAVFAHLAHVATISNTYTAIWNSWLTDHNRVAADAPSLERHRPTFDTRTGEGGLDIWIPLKT